MNHRGSQAQHRDADSESELERETVFDFLKENDPIDEEQWIQSSATSKGTD